MFKQKRLLILAIVLIIILVTAFLFLVLNNSGKSESLNGKQGTKASDWGSICTDSDQCQGWCELQEKPKEKGNKGTCSEFTDWNAGCIVKLEEGIAQKTICKPWKETPLME